MKVNPLSSHSKAGLYVSGLESTRVDLDSTNRVSSQDKSNAWLPLESP